MKSNKQTPGGAQAATSNHGAQSSPIAAHIAAWAAVALATWVSAQWALATAGTPIAAGTMIAVILLMEAVALILVSSARPKGLGHGMAVVAAFIVLELGNGAAGHMGLVTMDHAGIAAKRAPYEKTLAAAEIAQTTAQTTLDRYDAETARLAGVRSDLLKNSNGNYVTANTNAAAAGEQAASEREMNRAPLAADLTKAKAATKAAALDLDNAAEKRPEWQWMLVAGIFILAKGGLVWLTRSGSPVSVASGVMVRITREEADAMSEAELLALASVGKSVAQTATWALRRKTGEPGLSVVA